MLNRFIYRSAQALRHLGVDFHEERDLRVQEMRKTIRDNGSIRFRIEVMKDGSWVAESENVDGIITGGTSKDRMNETLKDAIFTFFQIPPHLCNDALMQGQDEPIRLERRVYA